MAQKHLINKDKQKWNKSADVVKKGGLKCIEIKSVSRRDSIVNDVVVVALYEEVIGWSGVSSTVGWVDCSWASGFGLVVSCFGFLVADVIGWSKVLQFVFLAFRVGLIVAKTLRPPVKDLINLKRDEVTNLIRINEICLLMKSWSNKLYKD